MKKTFRTLREAIEYGYEPVNTKRDKDITKGRYFGYEWQHPDGRTSVDIFFTHERNKIGQLGAFSPMFPPKNPKNQ